jgi:hypothetical protein
MIQCYAEIGRGIGRLILGRVVGGEVKKQIGSLLATISSK